MITRLESPRRGAGEKGPPTLETCQDPTTAKLGSWACGGTVPTIIDIGYSICSNDVPSEVSSRPFNGRRMLANNAVWRPLNRSLLVVAHPKLVDLNSHFLTPYFASIQAFSSVPPQRGVKWRWRVSF